jgi:hypothetical protein
MLSSSWIRASCAPADAGGGRRPGADAKGRAPARGSGVWVRHGVYGIRYCCRTRGANSRPRTSRRALLSRSRTRPAYNSRNRRRFRNRRPPSTQTYDRLTLFDISRRRLSARGAARHRHRAHRSPRRPRRRRARHRRPCRRQPRTCGQQLHRDAARYRTMAQLERKIHVRRAPGAEMAHADTSLGQKVNRDPESWGPRRSPSSCTAFLVTSVHLASPP